MTQFTPTLEGPIIAFARHEKKENHPDTNNTPLTRNVNNIVRQINDSTKNDKVTERRK